MGNLYEDRHMVSAWMRNFETNRNNRLHNTPNPKS